MCVCMHVSVCVDKPVTVELRCHAIALISSPEPSCSQDQRTNGPVNAHLISWPSKAQNIQNMENRLVKK